MPFFRWVALAAAVTVIEAADNCATKSLADCFSDECVVYDHKCVLKCAHDTACPSKRCQEEKHSDSCEPKCSSFSGAFKVDGTFDEFQEHTWDTLHPQNGTMPTWIVATGSRSKTFEVVGGTGGMKLSRDKGKYYMETLSPQGGAFVGISSISNGDSEVFGTTMKNLEAGETYTVSFYYGNSGRKHNEREPLASSVFIDGEKIWTGPKISFNPKKWFHGTVQFTATKADHEVGFGHPGFPQAGCAWDGIIIAKGGSYTMDGVLPLPCPSDICDFKDDSCVPNQIFVKTENGEVHKFQINLNKELVEFQRIIEKKLGVAASKQILSTLKGKHLSDTTRTLAEHGLVSGDTVVLTVPETIEISVTNQDGKVFGPFEVEAGHSLTEIQKTIQKKTGVSPSKQNLLDAQGEPMTDGSKTMQEYGVGSGDVLVMSLTVKVVYKMENDKTKKYTFVVDPEATVDEMKALIHNKSDLSPEEQELMFESMELTTGSATLREMGVTMKKNTLHLTKMRRWVVRAGGDVYGMAAGVTPVEGGNLWPKGTLSEIKGDVLADPKMLMWVPIGSNPYPSGTEVEYWCPEDSNGCDFWFATHFCPGRCDDTSGGMVAQSSREHVSGAAVPQFHHGSKSDLRTVGFYTRVGAGEKYLLGTSTGSLRYFMVYMRLFDDICPAETNEKDCKKLPGCKYIAKLGSCQLDWSPTTKGFLPSRAPTCECA